MRKSIIWMVLPKIQLKTNKKKLRKKLRKKPRRKLRKKPRKRLRKKKQLKRKQKKKNKKKLAKPHKKRKKARNQTRNQQIQVATSEIEKGDGTDQMVNLLLRKKSEKLDCSGRKNLVDIQSKSRWKTVFLLLVLMYYSKIVKILNTFWRLK